MMPVSRAAFSLQVTQHLAYVVGYGEEGIMIWDIETGRKEEICSDSCESGARTVAISNGKRCIVSGSVSSALHTW